MVYVLYNYLVRKILNNIYYNLKFEEKKNVYIIYLLKIEFFNYNLNIKRKYFIVSLLKNC